MVLRALVIPQVASRSIVGTTPTLRAPTLAQCRALRSWNCCRSDRDAAAGLTLRFHRSRHRDGMAIDTR